MPCASLSGNTIPLPYHQCLHKHHTKIEILTQSAVFTKYVKHKKCIEVVMQLRVSILLIEWWTLFYHSVRQLQMNEHSLTHHRGLQRSSQPLQPHHIMAGRHASSLLYYNVVMTTKDAESGLLKIKLFYWVNVCPAKNATLALEQH